ncbi:MAG: hypothetical protein ACYCTV_06970 [Leptospirales bacterium]
MNGQKRVGICKILSVPVFLGIPVFLILVILPEQALAVAGLGNVMEGRILWVETRTLQNIQRLKNFFAEKNRGGDFYGLPVLPAEPLRPAPQPTGPVLGVSDLTRSAHEGMGEALGGIAQAPGEEAIGTGIHQMAYQASPQGALRLGADTQGHIYQMLLSIHKDLLYLLKEQSSSIGLEGRVINQTNQRTQLDQERIRMEIPQWIMFR